MNNCEFNVKRVIRSIWRIKTPFLVRMTSKGLFKGGGVRDGLQMRAKMATDRGRNDKMKSKGKPKENRGYILRVMTTK